MKNQIKIIAFLFLFLTIYWAKAQSPTAAPPYIALENGKGYFPLAVGGKVASLYTDAEEFAGVTRALKNLQSDLKKVTGTEPNLAQSTDFKEKNIVLVGTLEKNKAIDDLVKSGKLSIKEIQGKWETFLIQTIEKPFKDVEKALVVVGSDKRGTIFGIYDLSAQIGVSPWYWWADVPVKQQNNLFVKAGKYSAGEPHVKYRGIFINDEAPALSGWAWEKFGGFKSKMYENVFELILRLKGNFLWPAMWGNAFYDDDPLNPKLADEYGVVIGTSHHEPMMRAHDEWRRYGSGKWNYTVNDSVLRDFWRKSLQRTGNYESLVTVGMRGDGDEPMTEGTQIALLERVVKDQRQIISEVSGKKAEETPQVWALYKEVQDYYDKGMRVDDDITLLLCDDNWGNIRKLPNLAEKPRKGGYGIYYHFDYVGGPRNYKWVNTNPIARVWEQMHLAYQYKARQIWIVNVGDIKPMEFPISFFLDYAWNPNKIQAEDLQRYTEWWASQQFDNQYAKEIAEMLTKYTKYNSRRKPELLAPDTYSLFHYKEAETVVEEYNSLARRAEFLYNFMPAEQKDAFFQLVLHPIKACANLNELYLTVAKNRLYSQQGRLATNDLADKARKLFEKDAEISNFYHKNVANGKWNHFMSQTHIGYTYWQQPPNNVMPDVKIIHPSTENAEMAISVEGSEKFWTNPHKDIVLPTFHSLKREAFYFEVFNRGQRPFECSIETENNWVRLSFTKGMIEKEQRVWINIDWEKVPQGKSETTLKVKDAKGKIIPIKLNLENVTLPADFKGFAESHGYVSMEAEHFSKAVGTNGITWKVIPNLGRTLSGVTSLPVTAPSQTPAGDSPRLEYVIHFSSASEVSVQAFFSPTLNFPNGNIEGLRYGISFDDEPVQVINLHKDNSEKAWEKWVADNMNIGTSKHNLGKAGQHTLKIWLIDSGLVLQKIVVDTGGLKPSYLGATESYFRK
jgi:hypothetical protein